MYTRRPRSQPHPILHRLMQGIGNVNAVGVKQQVAGCVAHTGIGLAEAHWAKLIVHIRRSRGKVYHSAAEGGVHWITAIA